MLTNKNTSAVAVVVVVVVVVRATRGAELAFPVGISVVLRCRWAGDRTMMEMNDDG